MISNNLKDIDECHQQWTRLNDHLFFRPYFAFYFLDLTELRLYYSRHKDYNNSLILDLKIDFKNQIFIYKNFNYYSVIGHSGHDNYKIESVRVNFSIKSLIPNEHLNKITNFKNDIKMEVMISTVDGLHKIQSPIKIRIKNFHEYNELKKKAIICSKQFYFDSNYAKTFIWWIELNRMHGYDKLVFYNHSIPNTPELKEAFERNSDFIEIKQLQCYPNFIDVNNTNKLFITNDDFKNVYKIDPLFYHLHLEFLCYNECFFENIDKYDYIAVYDQDESVIPRNLKKFTKLNIDTHVTRNDYTNAKCSSSSQHITSYFNELKYRLNLTGRYKDLDFKNGNYSFHFLMTLYIKDYTIINLFNELDLYFRNNSDFNDKYSFELTDPNDINQHGKKGVSFNVLIEDKKQHLYAKSIYDLYKKEIEPFMKRNQKIINKMPEVFSRLFLVGNETTSWMCGKTIHHTQNPLWVSNHYPEGNNFKNLIWTQQEYGQVSHFRTSLKDLNERNISIHHFNFDLNYFLCYFKPISKKLNYNLVF